MHHLTEFPQDTFKKFLKHFAYATGLATVMVDCHGKELSEHYHHNNFCQLMRSKADYQKKRDLSARLHAIKHGQSAPYTFHDGLIAITVPIIHHNQIIGFILSGHILADSQAFHAIYPPSNWRKYPDLVAEFNQLQLLSPQQLSHAAELLALTTQYYFSSSPFSTDAANLIHNITMIPSEQPCVATLTEDLFNKANQSVTIHQNLRPEIIEALLFIDHQFMHGITLSKVADHVFLQPSYFSKLFKKETGFTFIDYVNRKKIISSMLMLTDFSQSLETIAHRLGFQHPSYYTKLFKKISGTTPANYRKHLPLKKREP